MSYFLNISNCFTVNIAQLLPAETYLIVSLLMLLSVAIFHPFFEPLFASLFPPTSN